MCPHLRRCDDGAARLGKVTVLFPFDSEFRLLAQSEKREREREKCFSGGGSSRDNALQMAGMARSVKERERVFFIRRKVKILACATLEVF